VLTAILARVAIPQQCLCYLFHADGGGEQVLLGIKRQGFGAGKVMGLGGHVDPGETVADAAAREVYEESGLKVDPADLVEGAVITFRFPTRPEWDAVVTAYRAQSWTGELRESDELTKYL
jgi:8-oxo-dGTP diphosphatase